MKKVNVLLIVCLTLCSSLMNIALVSASDETIYALQTNDLSESVVMDDFTRIHDDSNFIQRYSTFNMINQQIINIYGIEEIVDESYLPISTSDYSTNNYQLDSALNLYSKVLRTDAEVLYTSINEFYIPFFPTLSNEYFKSDFDIVFNTMLGLGNSIINFTLVYENEQVNYSIEVEKGINNRLRSQITIMNTTDNTITKSSYSEYINYINLNTLLLQYQLKADSHYFNFTNLVFTESIISELSERLVSNTKIDRMFIHVKYNDLSIDTYLQIFALDSQANYQLLQQNQPIDRNAYTNRIHSYYFPYIHNFNPDIFHLNYEVVVGALDYQIGLNRPCFNNLGYYNQYSIGASYNYIAQIPYNPLSLKSEHNSLNNYESFFVGTNWANSIYHNFTIDIVINKNNFTIDVKSTNITLYQNNNQISSILRKYYQDTPVLFTIYRFNDIISASLVVGSLLVYKIPNAFIYTTDIIEVYLSRKSGVGYASMSGVGYGNISIDDYNWLNDETNTIFPFTENLDLQSRTNLRKGNETFISTELHTPFLDTTENQYNKIYVNETFESHEFVLLSEYRETTTTKFLTYYNRTLENTNGLIDLWFYEESFTTALTNNKIVFYLNSATFSYTIFAMNGSCNDIYGNTITYFTDSWNRLTISYNLSHAVFKINSQSITINKNYVVNKFTIKGLIEGSASNIHAISVIDYNESTDYYENRIEDCYTIEEKSGLGLYRKWNNGYYLHTAMSYIESLDDSDSIVDNLPAWDSTITIPAFIKKQNEVLNYKNVINMSDNTGVARVDYSFTPVTNGNVEYYHATKDKTKAFSLFYIIGDLDSIITIGFGLNTGKISYVNSVNSYVAIKDINDNEFYHIRVNFNCLTDKVNVYVNNVLLMSNINFRFNNSNALKIRLLEGGLDISNSYYSAIANSFESNYFLNMNQLENTTINVETFYYSAIHKSLFNFVNISNAKVFRHVGLTQTKVLTNPTLLGFKTDNYFIVYHKINFSVSSSEQLNLQFFQYDFDTNVYSDLIQIFSLNTEYIEIISYPNTGLFNLDEYNFTYRFQGYGNGFFTPTLEIRFIVSTLFSYIKYDTITLLNMILEMIVPLIILLIFPFSLKQFGKKGIAFGLMLGFFMLILTNYLSGALGYIIGFVAFLAAIFITQKSRSEQNWQ